VAATRSSAARANLLGSGTAIVISVAQTFLIAPLCIVQLGTHVYGAWLAAAELLVWIQLLDVGIPNLMTQRIGAALGGGDRDVGARWSGTGLVLLSVIAVALVLLGVLGGPFVTAWSQVPQAEAGRFTACFQISVVASALLLLFNGVVGLSRGVQRTTLINAVSVTGAVTNLVVSLNLLLAGFGLWALAAGLAARAVVTVGGGLIFLHRLAREGHPTVFWPDKRVSAEILSLAPPMAGASIGYLLANHSEIMLVATVFGPVPAAVYALTRRAVDGLRTLLDTIAWAVYGGFAHLVTSDDRSRARTVLADVLSLRFASACLGGAIYVAVNEGFVTRLYGAESFGGLWLTVAFAVQMIVGGQSFLLNFLYRAAGRVREGSLLLAGEASVRVVAIVASLRMGGLVAAPWAGTLTSGLALVVAGVGLGRILPPGSQPSKRLEAWRRLGGLVVLTAGCVVGASVPPRSWSEIVLAAGLLGGIGGTFLVFIQPAKARARIFLNRTRR
jgi:O-antigen/teichoic acid export membrane protein